MSIKTFHETFSEMNLGLYCPKNDQCDICVGCKTGNIFEENYRSHIQRNDAARDKKAKDKENGQQQHVYTMDLQSILLCPMLKASSIYYKKKLVVHNFTIYNLKTNDGYCFIWNESEGQISANEFPCIIYYFIKTLANVKQGEEIILNSDGC